MEWRFTKLKRKKQPTPAADYPLDPDLVRLGLRLRKLRLRQFPGASLTAFARKSGVSKGSIQAVEAGEGKFGPGVGTLEKWLAACGTNIAEFYGARSSADFPELPFSFTPAETQFHQLLADILAAPMASDLPDCIYAILREFARAARELTAASSSSATPAARTARASPLPSLRRDEGSTGGSKAV